VLGEADAAPAVAETGSPGDTFAIGIIAANGATASNVLFELGKRWTGRDTVPIVAMVLPGAAVGDWVKQRCGVTVYRADIEEDWVELLGLLAAYLGVSAPLDLEGSHESLRQLTRWSKAVSSPARGSRVRRWLVPFTMVALGIGVGALAMWKHRPSQPTLVSAFRYDFESGTEGWTRDESSKGCVGVSHVRGQSKNGAGALSLRLRLDSSENRQGEAWVDLKKDPPFGMKPDAIDLRGRKVSAWVYAPLEAAGDPAQPNGVQLFVKDERWNSRYGQWRNVMPEEWMKLTLDPGAAGDSSLDTARVIAVGVKMALATGAQEEFDGEMLVDAVDW
jgi:hypothetical protein